ncbi:hypothetical protein Tco_0903623 [Tanacetum coccineum]
MLEDFSSNSKGKRTYAYTILFLELKTLNLSFLLEEQLLEPALNLTVHCCGLTSSSDQEVIVVEERRPDML